MPTTFGELSCAEDWASTGVNSPDFYHPLGFGYVNFPPAPTDSTKFGIPVPDGDGMVGLLINNGATNNYNMMSTCLKQPLRAGITYNFQFSLSTNTGVTNPVLAMYGSGAACPAVPTHANLSCLDPATNPTWVELGKATAALAPTTWQTLSFAITPTSDIYSVIIGGHCTSPPSGALPNYYHLDDMRLTVVTSPEVTSITPSGFFCNNTKELTATAIPAGGIWQWYKNGIALVGETNPIIALSTGGHTPGSYEVKYSALTTCDTMKYIAVPDDPLVFTPTQQNISCNGDCTGEINFTAVSGGTPPYSYSIDNQSTAPVVTANFTNLCEDNYDLVLEDFNGCTETDAINITAPPAHTVDVIPSQVICSGSNFNAIMFTGTPGGTYDWTNSNPAIGLPAAGVGNIPAFAGAVVGGPELATIEVTPSIGACVGTPRMFTLTVNPLGDASFDYMPLALCTSDAPILPIITGTPGGTFASVPAGLTINMASGEITPSLSMAGNYTVTYTTGGSCPVSSSVNIVVSAVPTLNAINNQFVCDGDNFTAINFVGSAGATFNWTNDNIAIGLAAAGVGDIPLFVGTTAAGTEIGNIQVTPSDGACTGTPQNFNLNVNPLENPFFNYTPVTLCPTDASLFPTGTAGSDPGIFTRTPLGLSLNPLTGEIRPVTSTPGNYQITFQTFGGCPADSTLNFTIAPVPFVNAIINQGVCAGNPFNPINFTGSAGAAYNWTNTNTAIGLTANGIGNIPAFPGTAVGMTETATIEVTPVTGGCLGAPQVFNLTATPSDDASFTYPSAAFCTAEGPTPANITGVTGGSFICVPAAGLTFNTTTGEITPGKSTPGNYDVTYTTPGVCPGSNTENITISETPVMDPITDQTICVGTNFSNITFTGSAGATYNWTNTNTAVGLAANGMGNIPSFAGTAVGMTETATVEVTPSAGVCPGVSQNFTLTVNPADDASFTYPSVILCSSDGPVAANITGVPGGTFTSTIGLTLDATTGEIVPGTSTPGNYVVTYTTITGVCPANTTVNITITQTPLVDPIVDETVCTGVNFTTISFAGTAGATYNWTNTNPAIGLNANGAGDIMAFPGTAVAATEIGIIEVTPIIGTCAGNPQNATLTVNPADDATFNYTSNIICTSDMPSIPVVTGTLGGNFSHVPAVGLTIDPLSGEITPGTSIVGNYDVSYTTTGICPEMNTVAITISAGPTVNPVIDQVICAGDDFTVINFAGSAGATFNWTNTNTAIGLAANGAGDITAFTGTAGINAETGIIEVTPSTGACIGTPELFNLTVNPADDATFNYTSNTICTSDMPSTPVVTGTLGGNFSTLPLAGLTIDPLSGEITPGTSIVGNYDVTYTTTGICPEMNTVAITISAGPTVNPVIDQVMCAGDDFTVINFAGSAGATFDWTNTNTAIGLGANGAGNIAAFAGTANATAEAATIEVTPSTGTCIGALESFTLTVNPADDATFNYTSNTICTSDMASTPVVTGTLGGNFSHVPVVGLTIDPISGEITPGTSIVGNYDVTYTTTGICPEMNTVAITISAGPTVNPVIDQVICAGDDFTVINFAGSAGATFDWTNTNTAIGLAANGAGDITAFTGTAGTTAETGIIEVTPSTGTCIGPIESFTLTVNPTDDASFSYTSNTFCTSDASSIPLVTGILGGNFSTLPTPGLSIDMLSGEITPATSIPGIYDVTYKTTGICPRTITEIITVSPTPFVDPINDQTICVGDNFIAIPFTGIPGTTFDWTNTNIAIGLGVNGAGDIAPFLGTTNGAAEIAIIEVIPTNGLCIGNPVNFNLTVNPLPVVLFEADVLAGCAPLEVNFSNISPLPGDCFWDFGNGDSTLIPDCSGATVSYEEGTYDVSFSLTSKEGCTSTVQIVNYINVVPRPKAEFNANKDEITSFQPELEFMNTSTNATTYNWDFGDDILSTEESPVHEYTIGDEKTITVTLWAHNDFCYDSTQYTMSVKEYLVFYVPNTFTPNGNGMNEIFQPVFTSGYNPDDYQFSIFNRWGELIFQTRSTDAGWDGTHSGIRVQDGVYTWKIIVAEKASEIRLERIGTVNLLK